MSKSNSLYAKQNNDTIELCARMLQWRYQKRDKISIRNHIAGILKDSQILTER